MRLRLQILGALLFGLVLTGCQRYDFIEIEPSRVELSRRGETAQLSAKALDRAGHYYPDVLIDWDSENPQVATIDDSGVVTAHGAGSTWLVAEAGDVTSKVRVDVSLVDRVEAVDDDVVLSLKNKDRVVPRILVYDHQGRPVTGRQVFLKPEDPAIVTVDAQGGLNPEEAGETTVVADVEGRTAEIHVRVTPN